MPATKSAPASARAASVFIAAVCLALWLALTLLVTKGGFPTPYLDEFRFWRIYAGAKEGVLDFRDFFELHNGAHLYAVLKLWFWTVVHLGLDWRISMHVQVLFIVATAGMAMKYGTGAHPTRFSLLMGLTAALALSSARQYDNLYWAMQVSAAAMLLSSMLSFYHVARLHETQKIKHATLAFLFATLALLSSGGGAVTLPISTAAIFLASKNRRLKLIALSAGCVVLAAYASLVARHPVMQLFILKLGVGGISDNSFLEAAKKLAIYFPQFFSNALHSFSLRADDTASLCSGTAVLALSAYTLFSSYRKGRCILPCLLICFALASCAAVATTRIALSAPTESRYYPFAAALLAGNALALRRPENLWQKTVALLLAALTAASFLYNYGVQFKEAPQHKQNAREAHMHLCAGKDKNNHQSLAWIADSPTDLAYADLETIRRIFCREKDVQQIQAPGNGRAAPAP